MAKITASVNADLTNETYIKLAIALSVPILLYVFLLIITKNLR